MIFYGLSCAACYKGGNRVIVQTELAEINMEALYHHFIKTGELQSSSINPIIAASWQRCFSMGVNPSDGRSSCILSDVELEALLAKRADLINVSLPLMKQIYKFVSGSGFLVMLTDEQGYIMEVLGDSEPLKNAEQLNFIKGAAWTEKEVGTNAIGTVVMVAEPLQISGCEHYCQEHHHWTCSSAPIFDEQGKLIGILDMSGPSQETHKHTLGIVVSAAQAIMFQMGLQQKNRELTITNNRMQNIFYTMSDGVIVLNRDGLIMQLNPVAEDILMRKNNDVKMLAIDQLISNSSQVKNMLNSGEDYDDIETVMQTLTGPVYCIASAKPIRDDNGRLTGGVIIFNLIKKIKNLVNRFSGAHATFQFEDIIGKSQRLQECIQIASLSAARKSNILLQGESGTGKELFAQAIHNRSANKKGPFLAINCGAIPRDLLGSELFGYVEGAFTGALKGGRPGKFEMASGGTLFLDEIGEMPLGEQVALLRVIQEKQITRIGDSRVIPVDVRIICASNRNLRKEVENGGFRQDLYYRLNVMFIALPSLRERRDDIPVLLKYFLKDISLKMGLPVAHIDLETTEYLISYDWPGNVRELQNVVERMINISNGADITLHHLPQEILHPVQKIDYTAVAGDDVQNTVNSKRIGRKQLFAELEQQEIMNLLSQNGGNVSQAAREMGISRNSIYRKMKRYNISIS
jgi:transcriptional regulator of acetoin/glycerol metabolism